MLKELFDRALDDEPVFGDGDIAQRAMAQGRGIRRRRRALTAGGAVAAAVVAVVVALNLVPGTAGSPPPAPVPAAVALIARVEPGCVWWPMSDDATDVYVSLVPDITEPQREALGKALRNDPLVRNLLFESRQEAYERFKQLWTDSPEFVASVDTESLPDSFRVKLARSSQYAKFEATYAGRPGVAALIGGVCP
ncbi:permease-like cell division protein FtsX [Actinoplanes sp. CA-054009]